MKIIQKPPFINFPSCPGLSRGIFITDGSNMGGGGGASAKAPDAGIQPAGNSVLTHTSNNPETIESLIHAYHAVLSRMQPTEMNISNMRRIQYNPACLVDGELVSVDIMLNTGELIDGQFVKLETPRIAGIRIASQTHYVVLLHPAERTQDRYAPGTDGFSFACRVVRELRQRIDHPDPAVEQRMRELAAARCNENDKIDVPLSVLYPNSYDRTSARIYELEVRSESLAPLKSMRHISFVQLVAKLVRTHYPDRDRVTGNEMTWDELEGHDGIFSTNIAEFYAPNERVGDVAHIDLRKTARYPDIDHGYSPIRNGFMIMLDLDEADDVVRLTITRGEDESVHKGTIQAFLDLYQVIVGAGYPVVIDKEVREVALGTGTEKVSRADHRLPKDGGYILTPETVTVADPLPTDAPTALPPIERY